MSESDIKSKIKIQLPSQELQEKILREQKLMHHGQLYAVDTTIEADNEKVIQHLLEKIPFLK